MGVEINLNPQAIKAIENAIKQSAVETMEALKTDLINSETMPRDEGDMQDKCTSVEQTEDGAALITGSPQARRLYYHPEYNFQKKNSNAGAHWLEPYISGDKKEFIPEKFAEILKEKL